MKIAVLLGGTSAERDVSLVTGIEIARALRSNGHQVEAIDCAYGDRVLPDLDIPIEDIIRSTPSDYEQKHQELDRNVFRTIDYLLQAKFDVVYIALHGGYGENGQLQAMLEVAGIPFTGSGALASALGMDKHYSKVLFRNAGVPTAPWVTLSHPEEDFAPFIEQYSLPVVVKPNGQGSSVGLKIVSRAEELRDAIRFAFRHGNSVLLEQYIPGHEMTVAILNNEPLPVIEIIPDQGVYDYEHKYQKGKTRYVVPAEIPDKVTRKLQEYARRAYRELGCRHYARIDFRLTDEGEMYCLEVNTLPGMTPTSLVPKAARAVGIDFPELVERIVQMAAIP